MARHIEGKGLLVAISSSKRPVMLPETGPWSLSVESVTRQDGSVGWISSVLVADASVDIAGWIAKKVLALMLWFGVALLLISFGHQEQWVAFCVVAVVSVALQAKLSVRAHRRRRTAAVALEARQLDAARRRAAMRERSLAGRTVEHSKDAAAVAGVAVAVAAAPFVVGGHWVATRVRTHREAREARDGALLKMFGK